MAESSTRILTITLKNWEGFSMLPFDVKKYTQNQENEARKANATKCSQQAIANRIVSNSFPMQSNAQPIQQIPAKQ